jgi:hypothetical protein
MNLFRSIGMVFWGWRSAWPCWTRREIYGPFVLLAVVQILALWGLVSFHRALLLPLTLPFIRWVAGDAGTHYPVFYFALPTVYSRVSLILSIVLGSLAVGAATIIFARIFGGSTDENPWRTASRRYPALFVITLILGILLYGVSMIQDVVPRDAVLSSKIVRWGSRMGILALYIAVEALFAYGSAWIVLRGSSVLAAIRKSIRLTLSNFVATFLIVGAPAILLYVFSYAYGRADWIAEKLRPETIGQILLIQIVLEIGLGFFVVGAITRVFLYRTEES